MKLLEYEAKQLLDASGVPTPRSTLIIRSLSDVEALLPCVLKSQVPVGGRGKLGGVRLVHTPDELSLAVKELFAHEIKGFTPKKLLAEEIVETAREFYLSISVNRSTAAIELVAHAAGGVEIESHDSGEFFRHALTKDLVTAVGDNLADYLGVPENTFALQDMIGKLYDCFVTNDATLLEVNPLILTKLNQLTAADCKTILDDDATFRHPEWKFETSSTNSNFVVLNPEGTVATIANGAGLAMATVDAVKSARLTPANFLDIGGAATVQSIVDSFTKIVEFPHIQTIIVNIFGGIVRCDDVARAIIEARKQFPNLPTLAIRLSGTNSDEAAELLQESGLALYQNLEACIGGIHRG